MKKALLGIICLLTITMASVWVVSLNAFGTAPRYPPCDKVPSWHLLTGTLPMIYLWDPGDRSIPAGKSLARGIYGWKDWSTRSADQQKMWLSGTAIYLFIDGKFMPLKVDICYDKDGQWYGGNADTVYKVFYLVIDPHQYSGDHDFVAIFFWSGALDSWTGPPPNPNEFVVTFT